MPIKSINTCKTKIAHWALKNIELQSHISDAYLKEKINDTTHVCSTIFSTHDNPSCEQPLIQKAVLAVHSRETRNFSRDSSRFLRDESRFLRYESRFSRYESRFSRGGGNLHLSGTVNHVQQHLIRFPLLLGTRLHVVYSYMYRCMSADKSSSPSGQCLHLFKFL